MTRIRTRVLVTLGVLALSVWSLYPLEKRIKLGLDLNGGVQLVLRVDTDDGVRAETVAEVERLREALGRRDVPFAAAQVTGAAEFVVSGITDAPAFRSASAASDVQFERSAQAGGYVFRMRPESVARLRDETVRLALETIERRVNELGVAEAVVARYTGRDRILVELPGVSDVDGAKHIIRSTAQLRLTLVERGPFPNRDAALQAYANVLPSDLEILPGRETADAADTPVYVVRRTAAVTGADLRTARTSADDFDRPAVAFTLKQDAARRFGEFTAQHIGRPMATMLDGRVMSVAMINSRIDGEGQIVGVSREEMVQQVINMKSGALPADLEYVEERTIGASLGKASVRAGVLASVAGLALVVLFMVSYYKRTGLNAFASMVLNLLILLGIMAAVPVTMTLPGIAGLILTVGMGVDSNVLIFERIKEELARGRTARAAVNAAFDRVWLTIVDTHVASLISAAVLYQFGTSPIRGFATTLAIGLLANAFTAVFVSKTLFLLLLRHPHNASAPLSIQWRMPRILKADIDFGRWRWHALVLSLVVILAGAATMVRKGLPLGIDFSGGTLVVVEFPDGGVTEEAVRGAVASLPGDEVVQQYGAAEERRFLIRSPLLPSATADNSLEARVRQVTQALEGGALPAFRVVDRELVSASIGEDLQRRGIYATLASIVAITIYIGLRFRLSFAIGGIAATLHDILVTLACLALAGYDLSLNVAAALLTITGYSVNDTIVVFDRVRETLKGSRDPLQKVVNQSVNQTLSRTLITAATTFLSALALFLFGGEALEGFAFTMLVGIVSGTYSTVFIASAIAIVLSRRRRRVAGRREIAIERS
ncbi:MAG TPA: protein translocase subunit SecD [Vicinamibacterales bacterium]|nr:protein translocase subunit SecD [Vicinamibacterales bacterium]